VTLTLEITSPQPGDVVARCAFRDEGGSIGREISNAWVLPHSKVSGLHAVISYRNGVFYIEDRSRNGVCLNSSRNRLDRGRPYPLTSGDSILIDPYEIRVSINPADDERPRPGVENRGGGQRPNRRVDLPDPFDAADPFAPLPINSLGLDTPADDLPRQALDPMELLNLAPPDRAQARKVRTGQDLQAGSLLDDVVKVPAAVPDPAKSPVDSRAHASTIPENYDPLAPDDVFAAPPTPERRPEPRVMPARPRVEPPAAAPIAAVREPSPLAAPAPRPPIVNPAPESPVAGHDPEAPAVLAPPVTPAEPLKGSSRVDVDFAAVLRGAGLDPAEVTPEVAQEFGQILRVVVAGVMDVMRSRQQIKDEFRMQVTRVRPIENNPLKFSADVDDAMHNLLLKRNRAYLHPVEAFEDAFADLRHHQIAMLAGMRVAFEAMLGEFDPDRLQEEFDRQLGKGLVPAKLRYWDLYREKRHEIVKDPETSFRRLFGETFARAYEEQLRELKAQERGAGSPNRKPSDA
jgi:type VI secretion system FHA domain protein